jgi:single-strand DNA-binding protein
VCGDLFENTTRKQYNTMPNYNHVTLIGNITRDIEIKRTVSGRYIAELGIAINRNWTTEGGEKREETTFVDVTLWGRVAEIVGDYCKKGDPIFIEGRLTLDQWEDKQTGQKRSKLKVTGDNIQLLGRAPTTRKEASPSDKPTANSDSDVADDDIPF